MKTSIQNFAFGFLLVLISFFVQAKNYENYKTEKQPEKTEKEIPSVEVPVVYSNFEATKQETYFGCRSVPVTRSKIS